MKSVVAVYEFMTAVSPLVALGLLLALLAVRRILVKARKDRRDLEASLRLLEEERHLLELIAGGASLKEMLDALTRAVEKMVPDCICTVLLVDQERGVLEHGSAPNLPPAYWNVCHGLPVAPDVGCCPTAAFTNKIVIAEDISTDFRWAPIKDFALSFGLHACWSVPIRDSERKHVIGTFAMYHRHPAKPGAFDLRAVETGAHLAGNAIERLRAEEKLRDYSERFKLAEKIASFGVWQWDAKDNLFTLSESCAALSKLAGHQPRVTAEELYATVHPEDAVVAGRAREKAFCDRGNYEFEFRRILQDGSVHWYRNRAHTEFKDGAPRRMVGAIIDITQQKELLLSLENAKATAEAAVQAKGQFLANMSHEIRTPMNAVMGMTSLLLDLDLPQEAHEFVNTIRSSSDSLLSILNDILDFSKIESGKLTLESIPISLQECLEEAAELLVPKAGEKGLEMAVDLDTAVSEWIYSDATRLRQIVVNLVSNAVKFTDHGEIIVRARKTAGPEGDDLLHISVQDTGIGIDPGKLSQLFLSFSQVDASTTRKYGGTGLGLAISKRLSESMGGRMWVESEVGVGSTFQFTIPYKPAPAQKIAPTPASDWKGKRVLVVDDNSTNRLILTAFLTKWHLSSTAVASAREALEIMRNETFDLLLLDWHMPDIDGVDLALSIKAEFESAAPPMIMLSSSATGARERLKDEASPFAAFINKPIRRQHLHRVLLRVLSGVSEFSSSPRTLDTSLALRAPLDILVADDNLINQKVAARLLERWGYRPDIVSNGVEVLEALRRRHYDVVLLDVQMPEMDGLEAARRIHAEWTPDMRPVLTALTAGAMKEDQERCLAVGMDYYLSKPLNVIELQATLEKCHTRLAARASLGTISSSEEMLSVS